MPVARGPKNESETRTESQVRKKMDLYTERVDDAFLLLLDVLEATDPLPSIAHGADSGSPVWALESRNEEVPYSRARDAGTTGQSDATEKKKAKLVSTGGLEGERNT
jgi:hypothetical protein